LQISSPSSPNEFCNEVNNESSWFGISSSGIARKARARQASSLDTGRLGTEASVSFTESIRTWLKAVWSVFTLDKDD